ncbi:hypothetical protein Tco_0002030 [Tanacetum coccineum]
MRLGACSFEGESEGGQKSVPHRGTPSWMRCSLRSGGGGGDLGDGLMVVVGVVIDGAVRDGMCSVGRWNGWRWRCPAKGYTTTTYKAKKGRGAP